MVQFNILDVDYKWWALVSVCNRTLMRNSFLDSAVESESKLSGRKFKRVAATYFCFPH